MRRLYVRLLSSLGLLTSSDEPIKKTPDELVGEHEGDAESRVRAMMESAKGHVLIIDEAYQLSTSVYVKKKYHCYSHHFYSHNMQIWTACSRRHRCEN